MLKTLILVSSFLSPYFLFAQEKENWDTYMAQYEKGAGTTLLNMSLKKIAPVKDLSFALITGVKFTDCSPEGFPSKKEFGNLYIISDSVKARVDRVVKNNMVGTFTYQGERLDYFYVADTAGLRQQLIQL